MIDQNVATKGIAIMNFARDMQRAVHVRPPAFPRTPVPTLGRTVRALAAVADERRLRTRLDHSCTALGGWRGRRRHGAGTPQW